MLLTFVEAPPYVPWLWVTICCLKVLLQDHLMRGQPDLSGRDNGLLGQPHTSQLLALAFGTVGSSCIKWMIRLDPAWSHAPPKGKGGLGSSLQPSTSS